MQEDQRFRSLFEVEIETKFPVISEQTKFRNRNADDVRDGYVEILPYRETFDNTVKTRVHASSQITPSKKTVSVQTVCTFPTHKWTQYGYEYEPPVEVPIIVKKGQPRPKTPLEKFLSSSGVDPIYDEMVYNSILNLYKDDYPDLCTDEYSSKSSQNLEFNEFMSFADVINCQDKLIEACSWHHSWSGIVALSYVDASTSSRLQSKPSRDEVYRAIQGKNPVLLWSTSETLHPILELYAPREVRELEFCPFNENLLLGGLMNGQVILWDLTNRIKFEEQNEVLTHRRPISSIVWLPPQFRINRSGQSSTVPSANVNPSYQFLTSSEDGCIYFWDLSLEVDSTQEIKKERVSKRLHTRLPELNVDRSPYCVLNGFLKPFYKLNIPKQGKQDLVINPITCISMPPIYVDYIKISETNARNITSQVIFEPKIPLDVKPFEQVVYIGFVDGEFGVAKWLGYEIDTGSPLNVETLEIQMFRQAHDGSILDIITTKFLENTILTIGGKLAALWDRNFQLAPIFVIRKSKSVTCASWSLFRPSCFHIGLSDGTIEIYDIIHRSDKPIVRQSVSGKGLTVIKSHIIKLNQNVFGIGDYRGTFRMLNIPSIFCENNAEIHNTVKKILHSAVQRRRDFFEWQENWLEIHKDLINSIAQEKERAKEERTKQLEEEIRMAEQLEQKRIDDERKRILAESRPQPGQYEKWAQKKFDDMQAIRMHNVLLEKKQLRREDLVIYLAPLNRIEDEKKKKAIKQEKMLGKKSKLFEDALAISFPETQDADCGFTKKQPVSKISDESKLIDRSTIRKYLNMYEEYEVNSYSLIDSNRYEVKVTWSDVLKRGNERKTTIDIGLKLNSKHRNRIKTDPPKLLPTIAEISSSSIPSIRSQGGTIHTIMKPDEESELSIEMEHEVELDE
ncbi:dynein axonemal intermediate chain 3 [Chrysoperla carnea]|uniref:dynein axonemal intermediate chain 3 n=1 Tax=Chrysoperla carnea TaxID=189513 RepID=UPI001D065F8D|nr:dynein axonemal intermediate chain 3 [Chrysoperla carnea]